MHFRIETGRDGDRDPVGILFGIFGIRDPGRDLTPQNIESRFLSRLERLNLKPDRTPPPKQFVMVSGFSISSNFSQICASFV